ncbi:crt homolog 2-like [Pecten maximus]|uniref:crt homolog 2-like n=1 Tax=Pecten maximus TaxID=6579 RepID=UPI0014590506|nr:crt homolog 2-like [Pecten maximus]
MSPTLTSFIGRFLVCFLTCGIILTLSTSTIFTPLWLDSISPGNITANGSSTDSFRHVDGFSIIFQVNLVFLLLSGIIVLYLKLCSNQLTSANQSFPKLQFFWIGFADALSSIFSVYASGGKRTAPYLQAIAINLAIPVTFIIRYILLKKHPTPRKAIAALTVLVAEFIALIPSIFPSLQSTEAREEDGGAKGIAGVLWPLCYTLAYIPQGVVNVVIERSTKSQMRTHTGELDHVHPFYLMFWSFLFCSLSMIALFWTDILPGFGMTDDITDFGNVFLFNLKCFVGLDHCRTDMYLFAWACILAMFTNRILVILFLRFSEGANYLVVIQSLQTPVVLLFWTLFQEHPFRWNPEGHLSTWLSIVAVAIILPAIYVYNKSDMESSDKQNYQLLPDNITYQSIQADSPNGSEYSYPVSFPDESATE